MTQSVDLIQSIANVIDAVSSPTYVNLGIDAGSKGVFEYVDSVDVDSGTCIVYCKDGLPYEVRVRRVTEADCQIDKDGVLPDPIQVKEDE